MFLIYVQEKILKVESNQRKLSITSPNTKSNRCGTEKDCDKDDGPVNETNS